MSATTDDKASINYNPIEQPGISNLLQILALLRGHPLDDVEAACKGRRTMVISNVSLQMKLQAF